MQTRSETGKGGLYGKGTLSCSGAVPSMWAANGCYNITVFPLRNGAQWGVCPLPVLPAGRAAPSICGDFFAVPRFHQRSGKGVGRQLPNGKEYAGRGFNSPGP